MTARITARITACNTIMIYQSGNDAQFCAEVMNINIIFARAHIQKPPFYIPGYAPVYIPIAVNESTVPNIH